MGRAIMLIVIGFAITFGAVKQNLTRSSDRNMDVMLNTYENHTLNNTTLSGLNCALSEIFRDHHWRSGLDSTDFNGGKYIVTVADMDSVIRLTSTGIYGNDSRVTQVDVSYRALMGEQAIYATGDIVNVSALDEAGNPDPDLMTDNAESIPDFNMQELADLAETQVHDGQDHFIDTMLVGGAFSPDDEYPDDDFYYDGSTENVIYVPGDLVVQGGRTIYGVFLVEGNITLHGSARVEGVLYLMNLNHNCTIEVLVTGGGNPSESSVTGGIIANGDVRGTGNHVTVKYDSDYMEQFITHLLNPEQPITINSWSEY